jgi:hypothetical protein
VTEGVDHLWRVGDLCREDEHLLVPPLSAEDVPAEAKALKDELAAMLPFAPIASLLIELDARILRRHQRGRRGGTGQARHRRLAAAAARATARAGADALSVRPNQGSVVNGQPCRDRVAFTRGGSCGFSHVPAEAALVRVAPPHGAQQVAEQPRAPTASEEP